MTRPGWCGLLLLFLAFGFLLIHFSVATQSRRESLRVDEAVTQVQLLDNQVNVSLRVANSGREPIAAHIALELLDPRGVVRGAAERTETIAPGLSTVKMVFALSDLKEKERSELIWYRLRYRVSAEAAEKNARPPAEGILALAEVTPDVFELYVAAPEYVTNEGTYLVRVRAVHPVTWRPVPGVLIETAVDADDEELAAQLKRTGKTNSRGYAVLHLRLPAPAGDDEFDLKVTGRRGQFVAEAERSIRVFTLAKVLLSTDKPLYQPGQTLHMRALVFDAAHRAMADEPVRLTIHDPEETVVFRTTLSTSKFGIASSDWPIPDNQRLGDYRIQAEGTDQKDSRLGTNGASAAVKISRYDLPAFTVLAKPDHAYYLPGQNAEIEVRADYLFGKAVPRGHVRVVRETQRHWNYREQKWETEEAEKYEGDTDASGRFLARVALAAEHNALADEDDSRFNDLSYAAYFTDASTGRTEQQRLSLRLTKESIHVYVISPQNQQEGLPLEFYVTTFYADGLPAQCDVVLSQEDEDAETSDESKAPPLEPLRTIHTNRYGVAKVARLVLPESDSNADNDLYFEARDRKGRIGHHTESFWLSNSPNQLRVETDKALYRAGEPIVVKLEAAQPDLPVFVDALSEGHPVASQAVRLRKGRATVVFPPNPKFEDEIAIVAYSLGQFPSKGEDEEKAREVSGWHKVLFPRDRELKLNVQMARATYRPGEEVRADFRVQAPGGAGVAGALGVVVTDKAVEERARSDREFGATWGFYDRFASFWYDSEDLAGVRRSDLDKLDLSQPLPDGLELVAEVILNRGYYSVRTFASEAFEADKRKVFASLLDPQLKPLREALAEHFRKTEEYPKDAAVLRRILSAAGIQFDRLRDPWGMAFREVFEPRRDLESLILSSAGPDKKPGTGDDFSVTELGWPYFLRYAKAIGRAIDEHHARTGGYVRDTTTLQGELLRQGIDFAALRDPWGHAYRADFVTEQNWYKVNVSSAGPDGRFDVYDDVRVASAGIDYFRESRRKLDDALASQAGTQGNFPATEAEFRAVLQRAGMDLESLCDAWGHPYYVIFRIDARYTDRQVIERDASKPDAGQRTKVEPMTQEIAWILLRSRGPDGKEGTADDFDAASFSRILAEHSGRELSRSTRSYILFGSSGAITGIVTDVTGAVIAKTNVQAKERASGTSYTAESDEAGRFLLRNLSAGFYEVRFAASGFKVLTIANVQVLSSNITELNVRLDVGAVSQTVTVEAAAELLSTTSAMVAGGGRERATQIVTKSGQAKGEVRQSQLFSTPRLRQEFPETLLWRPEVETDGVGRARLKFPLADNITTWKMSVLASTADGQLGVAEKEIRAFQPFFVEHDPPKVLTDGDEIALPVVVRNYLDAPQAVSLEMKPEDWFTLLGPARQQTNVAAGDSARAIFPFRAIAPVKEGKQRVTAVAGQSSDAIEKKVRVRPDGEEVVVTSSQLFSDAATLELNIPEYALASGRQAELKLYPNLLAHVVESIEGIMRRPYGCAEQAISSGYPSLLLLLHYKHDKPFGFGQGQQESAALAARARRYAQMAYERLLSYRAPGGGFSYWGRGDADLALTAYALKFLDDASEVIEVDAGVRDEARQYLAGHVRPDGSWPAYDWQGSEDPRRTALLTAWVARVLARTAPSSAGPAKSAAVSTPEAVALKQALAYLAERTREIDEPYLLAQYSLAAIEARDAAGASRAVLRLRALAKEEGDTSYWALESNTPFYGWGLAGRLETTAVVLEALARQGGVQVPADPLIGRGLLFLLRKKDHFGVWYSTQATVNVLEAMLLLLDQTARDIAPRKPRAEIHVNGRLAANLDLPAGKDAIGPITVDLAPYLAAGSNRIEVRGAAGPLATSVQLVGSYYVPWARSAAKRVENELPMKSQSLRLAVRFDKTQAAVGEEIRCTVEAERIGFRGYGMLLAEIGLPPGADVSRESLDGAMQDSKWEISQYDVLPDRLVLYIWPRAGGAKLSFTFNARFGLRAVTPASRLYDYYNPEASVVVAPAGFVVQPFPGSR